MEPNKKKPNKRKKAGTLRGDVLRRASEKEVRGRGHARKSFSDFFIQFDEEDQLEDTRDWLSNRDDVSECAGICCVQFTCLPSPKRQTNFV